MTVSIIVGLYILGQASIGYGIASGNLLPVSFQCRAWFAVWSDVVIVRVL